jgi:PPOX class probable F420-dependent enzyme
MRRTSEWSRDRFDQARVARLATVDAAGRPHLVPVVFAVVADRLVTAVDGKPKSTTALRRLANIAANPTVSALVDEYRNDWDALWWARADGRAAVVEPAAAPQEYAALVAKYEQYRVDPPGGPVIVIDVQRWSGWSARSGAD